MLEFVFAFREEASNCPQDRQHATLRKVKSET